ncbi:hypothetical protein Tco_0697418 [Tanacetum coccineum]
MRTRSQSREQHPPPPEEPPVVIEPLRIEYPVSGRYPRIAMGNTRTMAQLLQAPTEGWKTFGTKFLAECIKIIEEPSPKFFKARAKAVVAKDKKKPTTSPSFQVVLAPAKAVELSCVTCGGAHSHQNCPATHGNVYRDNISEYVSQAAAANYNQVSSNFRPQMVANHIRPLGFPPVQNSQANNANNFNRGNKNQLHRP